MKITGGRAWNRMGRAKRENRCGIDEYFDSVVGHCSLCSDLCLPADRGTQSACALQCPSFYRRMIQQSVQEQQPQQQKHLPMIATASSTSPLSPKTDSSQTLYIIIPCVAFAVTLLAVLVFLILFLSKRGKGRSNSCPRSNSGMNRNGRYKSDEKQHQQPNIRQLSADAECATEDESQHPFQAAAAADDDTQFSSLCSVNSHRDSLQRYDRIAIAHAPPMTSDRSPMQAT